VVRGSTYFIAQLGMFAYSQNKTAAALIFTTADSLDCLEMLAIDQQSICVYVYLCTMSVFVLQRICSIAKLSVDLCLLYSK
jgi:hypothetical protein